MEGEVFDLNEEEEKQGETPIRDDSKCLYLPNRITKAENWQFVKPVAPTNEKKRWKTSDCIGAYCEQCKL